MKNFVFISPTFPDIYYQFPRAWKELGGTSLCIGEDDYNALPENLRQASDEYYRVSSLADYDQMYRAVAWFAHKHGKIDWLESNNEFWLEKDAQLRTDFNITTGDNSASVMRYKTKSGMKEFYHQAGVKTARWRIATTFEEGLKFVAEVGYPLIVKPDNGVGANSTWKVRNEEDLKHFYEVKGDVTYIMEEFITGEIWSYDGLVDQDGKILFRTVHVYKTSVMDVLNDFIENYFYSLREVPEELDTIGQNVLKAFDLKARFFHTEYFRMSEDKEGLGKAGDFVGLEVNMRPPGGYIPSMMNYSANIDLFRMYASMCMYNNVTPVTEHPYFCVFFGRRDRLNYRYTNEEMYAKYGWAIRESGRMPGVLRGMADQYYIACFETEEEVHAFAEMAAEKK